LTRPVRQGRCWAQPGKRSDGATGAEAQPATPWRGAGAQRRRSGRGGVGKCGGANPIRIDRGPSYDTWGASSSRRTCRRSGCSRTRASASGRLRWRATTLALNARV